MRASRSPAASRGHRTALALITRLVQHVGAAGLLLALASGCARRLGPGEPRARSHPARSTYYVEHGRLFDPCGEELVLRGVNHPTMYVDPEGRALPEIAKTGANVVRLFWFGGHGVDIGKLEPLIEAAVSLGMLPMLELHDSTCTWELASVVRFWTEPAARALIARHRRHLLVNIANEPSPPDDRAFVEGYRAAIARMRGAGIDVPLIIDGGRCGRDYAQLLRHGRELLRADPHHNLIFSAHLYDPLARETYAQLFATARALQLPFIVGEFANRVPPGCGAHIDYAALITEAQRAGIGWLAWSWGDDSPDSVFNRDCDEFDMTRTFEHQTLFGWGREVSLTLPASIRNTARRPYSLRHGGVCDERAH